MKNKLEKAKAALEVLTIYATEGGLLDSEIDVVFDAREDIEEALAALGTTFPTAFPMTFSVKGLDLSSGALRLLLCMGEESKGAEEFEFPKTVAEEYDIPVASLRRYVDELIAKGCILRGSRAGFGGANIYRFEKKV